MNHPRRAAERRPSSPEQGSAAAVEPRRGGARFAGRAALLTLLLLGAVLPARGFLSETSEAGEECTICILSGRLTKDGRPVMWKNRDTGMIDNEVAWFDDGRYRYVAVIDEGDLNKAWIGVNERGFAILNALSYNLTDTLNYGITNGELMKHALQFCADVKEFEDYLKQTNKIGRPNPANIAVLDSAGNGAIFEAGNRAFRRFDLNNPLHAPEGFLARTNFSLSADTSNSDTYRFNRCLKLVRDGLELGPLDARYLIDTVGRDVRPVGVDPYPLPYEGFPPGDPYAYGYVDASNTINRRTTCAAGAILGILPGEDPRLSTFFAVPGHPVLTPALPVWAVAGQTPPELDGKDGAPFCEEAILRMHKLYDYPYNGYMLNTFRLRNVQSSGFLPRVEEIESWVFADVEKDLATWRASGVDPAAMADEERRIARDAYVQYMNTPWGNPTIHSLVVAGPNPMTESTVLSVDRTRLVTGSRSAPSEIQLVDAAGRHVGNVAFRFGSARWDGRDAAGHRVPSGVYFLRAKGSAQALGSIVVLH